MYFLSVENLHLSFRLPNGKSQPVVEVPAFSMEHNQQIAIKGPSGSGKTTFLHMLAGVLTPDSGQILIDGQSLGAMNESDRDQLRSGMIGYIFQSFNLLNGFSCMENLLLAMNLNGSSNFDRARCLLDKVGLGDRKDHLPGQLSIGQQQRVAIARALINRPKLVLADEPTGNLDPTNTDCSLELLRSLCKEWESALILVSHDPRVIGKFEHQIDWEELNQVKESEEVEIEKQ
ncbi:ABC transporter ATP-binding protein [Opitutales bacterium]|nr:ABC transporter ATP-binding protein [Opitutales bacterium]